MSDLTPKENTALDVAMTRLGELVDRMERASHPYPRARTWPDCEGELETMTADTLTKDQSLELMQAEIERLRRSLDDHLDSEAAETRRADRERDRARTAEAEIERLRTALVADDLGALAYQSGWHARDAEVERLRELLRYAVPAGDAPKGWYQLVRVALGE